MHTKSNPSFGHFDMNPQLEKNISQTEIQLYEMSTALGHAVEGISRLDSQGRYLFVNEAYARMVGTTPAEMMGCDWQSTVHVEDRAKAIAAYQQMLAHGKAELEFRGLRRDGSVFDKSLVMVSAYDEQQRFTGHYCFMKDVSDRQQTAAKLQQQLERERLLAKITDAIRQTLDLNQILHTAVDQVRHFLRTDRVIAFRFLPDWQGIVEAESVTAGWTETLGMKIQDLCFGELYAENYRYGRVSAISNIDTADIGPCYEELLSAFQVKANLVVPILQGDHLWGLLIAHHCRAPREWEPENTQLLKQVATQMGIAIRQAELHQQTREQAALIDIATDAIFVRDLSGKIAFWSQGAERLYGWRQEEAIGQPVRQLLKKKDSLAIETAIRTTMEQGFWQGELTQSTKAGNEILVASRWTLMRDPAGHPQSLLEVNTDITEKKKLEAQFYQAQRLESLGQLASGIAHDLGNVLTPILGIAQLLRITQKNPDASTQQQLDILEKSAKRGVSMVKQILTFAQGSSDDTTTIDVAALLQEVIDVIRQGFPSSIEIHKSMPQSASGDGFGSVSADSTHLHQVFMNLCINARDAMPGGGVLTISVDSGFVDAAVASKIPDASVGHYMIVTVTDTGTGIPPEVRDRMFDPFFTTKSPDQGTGLGLATVLGIVKNAGGFLRVMSEVGQGTQIEVYLPSAN
ncbi:MAG: PAS domain S-box protein [Phormidesmis sp.]